MNFDEICNIARAERLRAEIAHRDETIDALREETARLEGALRDLAEDCKHTWRVDADCPVCSDDGCGKVCAYHAAWALLEGRS